MSRHDEAWARAQDAADPLAWCAAEFERPAGPDGAPLAYFCGNSLGLAPRRARDLVMAELEDWARLGVEGHMEGRHPWYRYHEPFREPLARLLGAGPGEVVVMNSLTVNLHLMLTSFYRPQGARWKVVIEESAFPSDAYAVASHLESRGLDAGKGVIRLAPRAGEDLLRPEDIERLLADRGAEVALVLLPGVQYYTGQRLDLARITAAAHRAGALAGFDLAHAAGNVPLSLHDWDVDFAVWCSYKYLNAGPGAVAGCFVHARHGADRSLPRLAGWWGNDPDTRFRMDRLPQFVPVAGADGWQLSNPPILSMAPLRASLELFDRAGMPALRAKSERLTGFLVEVVGALPAARVRSITPAAPQERGCQLSLRFGPEAHLVDQRLRERGFVCDFRSPDVVRVSPVPLYNSFHEVWRFGQALREVLAAG